MTNDTFIFKGWQVGKGRKTLLFFYTLKHKTESFGFKETITLPKVLSANDEKKTTPAIDFLALALGVSYWKTFCPNKIEIPFISLSKDQAEFWNTVYTKGLGEFFYKNNIDFHNKINFPENEITSIKLLKNSPMSRRALVLIGGGKDSLVSAEILREEGKEFSFFSLGDFPLIKKTAKTAGARLITIGRRIDKKLLKLNKRRDVYNGHVPVSLFYSGAAMLAAVLYGFDEVVLSAEKSASYGNVDYLGEVINHQWSKSEEAENLFRSYFRNFVTSDVIFHSMIRHFSELKVAERFSHYHKYFDVFSSCNKNFSLTKKTAKKWCGECPKCAFVFGILSPFIAKKQLVSIFGKNLFSDEKLLPIYRELLGVEALKPFECVGTPEETALAFLLTHKKGEYEKDPAMKQFVSAFEKHFDKIEHSRNSILPK